MRHIAVARFGHEGNSFGSVLATLADFKSCEWAAGSEEVLARYRGTNTEIGGAIDLLEHQPGWTAHYLRCAWATPSGEIEPAVFETIMADLLHGLAARAWDAVFLGQHGAMQVVGIEHADAEIIRRVRAVIGDAALGVSFDLHANITPDLLELLDVSVGYKCHPHTDMAATAQKCLRLLLETADHRIHPIGRVVPMNAILPTINARTSDGPMAEVAAFARGLELGGRLLDVTPYQGYAYGDRAYAGASSVVYADGDGPAAERAAQAVIAEMNRVRDRLMVHLPGAKEGLAEALALARQGRGPVAVIDSADHPGAGANADTPGLLRALLEASPDVPAAFVLFWDPDLVARLAEAGVGATLDLALGGRLTDAFGAPVRMRATVDRLTGGRIVHTGPVYHGMEFDFGRTAVLRVNGIKIVVTSNCLMVTDPTFFELHGIDLASLGVLAVKAKNQFRAAFSGVFRTMIDVDVPGPAAFDFTQLPFQRIPKTHFPFARARRPAG
ncbi:MAG: M81 family metallopeptidase [Verrucomicrobia bacterium]|nr:M81 family metallopeptidase [Verrucomicrobiota bacterium]